MEVSADSFFFHVTTHSWLSCKCFLMTTTSRKHSVKIVCLPDYIKVPHFIEVCLFVNFVVVVVQTMENTHVLAIQDQLITFNRIWM